MSKRRRNKNNNSEQGCEVIFIDSLPKLDLHGLDREIARVMINDFINDNIKMKNEIILIVHGIGTGILKNTTQQVLGKNKNIVDYKIYSFNVGCTIAQIKLTK